MHMLQYGHPHFTKACFMPLCFYKRPAIVSIFPDRRKSEEDFCFYEKSLFCNYRTGVHNKQHSPPCFSSELHSASQDQAAIALHRVCEHPYLSQNPLQNFWSVKHHGTDIIATLYRPHIYYIIPTSTVC